ncbi:MAG: hypothetical protein ABWY45_11155 [Mycobacterium sp.]
MSAQREDDLAWNLVEHHQGLMTAGERTVAYVDLGAGDFQAVIRSVLTILAGQEKSLSQQDAADVQSWIDCYDTKAEFGVLLAHAVGAAAVG